MALTQKSFQSAEVAVRMAALPGSLRVRVIESLFLRITFYAIFAKTAVVCGAPSSPELLEPSHARELRFNPGSRNEVISLFKKVGGLGEDNGSWAWDGWTSRLPNGSVKARTQRH